MITVDEEAVWNWLYDHQATSWWSLAEHCHSLDLEVAVVSKMIARWERAGWLTVDTSIATINCPEKIGILVRNCAPRLLTD